MPRSSEFDHAALTAILAPQYNVISRSQVLASGMTKRALEHRLRAGGPWQRLLPGIFLAVTGAPTSEQRDIAALLYAGAGSLLTGPAALRLWGVRASYASSIDVLIPESKQRKSAGFVRIHPTLRMPEQVFTAGPLRFAPVARAVGDTARGQSGRCPGLGRGRGPAAQVHARDARCRTRGGAGPALRAAARRR